MCGDVEGVWWWRGCSGEGSADAVWCSVKKPLQWRQRESPYSPISECQFQTLSVALQEQEQEVRAGAERARQGWAGKLDRRFQVCALYWCQPSTASSGLSPDLPVGGASTLLPWGGPTNPPPL